MANARYHIINIIGHAVKRTLKAIGEVKPEIVVRTVLISHADEILNSGFKVEKTGLPAPAFIDTTEINERYGYYVSSILRYRVYFAFGDDLCSIEVRGRMIAMKSKGPMSGYLIIKTEHAELVIKPISIDTGERIRTYPIEKQ